MSQLSPAVLWTILAVLALGVVLAVWVLRRDPGLGRRRCAGCWYDMDGVVGLRCPECGRLHAREEALRARRLRWGWFGVALVPVAVLLVLAVRTGATARLYYTVMPTWKVVGSRQVSRHRIIEYVARDPDDSRRRVDVRGLLTLSVVDYRVWAGVTVTSAPRTGPGQPLLADGSMDCTGDGTPDLIIEQFSGGAHCCTTYTIVQLGGEPKVLATIEAGNGAMWSPTETPGVLQMVGADYTFDYWLVPHVASPAPQVLLRWQEGEYRLWKPGMERPGLSAAQYAALRDELHAMPAGRDFDGKVIPPTRLWATLLDLAYTGHEAQGWRLLDESWNESWGDRAAFRAQLEEAWRASPWRESVRHWED